MNKYFFFQLFNMIITANVSQSIPFLPAFPTDGTLSAGFLPPVAPTFAAGLTLSFFDIGVPSASTFFDAALTALIAFIVGLAGLRFAGTFLAVVKNVTVNLQNRYNTHLEYELFFTFSVIFGRFDIRLLGHWFCVTLSSRCFRWARSRLFWSHFFIVIRLVTFL